MTSERPRNHGYYRPHWCPVRHVPEIQDVPRTAKHVKRRGLFPEVGNAWTYKYFRKRKKKKQFL